MRQDAVLITGALGEIGSNLIQEFRRRGAPLIVAMDLNSPEPAEEESGVERIRGDVLDTALLARLDASYDFHKIFHLAAILSTAGEREPAMTYHVNVQGTLNMLELARSQTERRGAGVRFIFPSTIAAYGLSCPTSADKEEFKARVGKVRETEYLEPITMYGINKLEVEHLGRYYARHYQLLGASASMPKIDFRCIRLPGVLSANSLPSGGTSDYAPEMIHAAAQGSHYECFTKPGTALAFMTMPDAVRALVGLSLAPRDRLSRCVYNVSGFSATARELRTAVLSHFPEASIAFRPQAQRLSILETWPADVDDSAARKDWNWAPLHNLERALEEYLVPGIRKRYESEAVTDQLEVV